MRHDMGLHLHPLMMLLGVAGVVALIFFFTMKPPRAMKEIDKLSARVVVLEEIIRKLPKP